MILLCTTALVAALTIVYYFRRQLSYWSSRKVDGPTPLPVFGNMLAYFQMKKHFGEVYDDIYKSFPNARYVGFYKFGVPSILVRSLDMTKMVLLDNFKSFQANDVYLEKKLDPLLSMNPFFVRGAEWKSKRSQLTPIFTAAKVKSAFPLIKGICERFSDYIERKSNVGYVFEARTLSTQFTIESVASCAFGLEANAFANEESSFVENTRKIFEISILQAMRLAATFFLPIISKLMKLSYLHKDVDPWLRSIINQVVEKRDETNEKRTDFLQSVLDMRDRKGSNYDESTIVGHSLSFLTDGYETSSGVMAYCFYQLAVNPEIHRRAQAEVDAVMRKYSGALTDESLKEMDYVENLIYETLRLNTPDFALNKLCTEDITLPPQYPDSGEEGVTIKAGTPVIIPIYSIHRNPYIFKDPLNFDPDRWSDVGKTQRYKYSFLAFGEGPRMCPGIRFGMMQSMAAVATVLSKFHIEIAGETQLPLTFSKISLTLTCEDGIWIRFIKRDHS